MVRTTRACYCGNSANNELCPALRGKGNTVPMPVALLERSFDLVAPRGAELVDRMYDTIFAASPAALALFGQTDMAAQKKKFLTTLLVLRNALRNFDALVPALRALGGQHAGFGVLPEHYPVIGAALISAMVEVGGARWLPEYTEAWTSAYQLVQEAMLGDALAAA